MKTALKNFQDVRYYFWSGLLVFVTGSAFVQGQPIVRYDASLGTLPTEQGFILCCATNPAPSVVAGVLRTFRFTENQDQEWHSYGTSLNFVTTAYELRADLHIISSDYVPVSGGSQRSGYFLDIVDAQGRSFIVGISSGGITINTDKNLSSSQGVTFKAFNSTDGFHLYRLRVQNGTGTLFIDGNLFASTPVGSPLTPTLANIVLFGKASGGAASAAELRSFALSYISPTDLKPTMLDWDNVLGGVRLALTIQGSALPFPSTGKLFWASGTTAGSIVPSAPVIFTHNIPAGASGPSAVINVPAANFANPPATATHVLLILDPDNLVQESDEGNNVLAIPLSQPDLAGVSFAWNNSTSGADFQYEVRNHPTTVTTTAKLFWASGTTTAAIIAGAPVVFTQNVASGASGSSAVINVSAANFASPPATATHVLLVLDPDNLVQESNEGNNVLAIPLSQPDLAGVSLAWNNSTGGADFQYEVSNNPTTVATTTKLFWASGTTTANVISGAPVISTQPIPIGASGLSAVIPVPATNFANPPATATHVLLVLDPDNLVQESNEGNNVAALALCPVSAWTTQCQSCPAYDESQLAVELRDALACLRLKLPLGGWIQPTCGYRSTEVQLHFFEVKQKFQELLRVPGVEGYVFLDQFQRRRPQLRTTAGPTVCQTKIDEVNAEILTHGFSPSSRDLSPVVAEQSLHELGRAVDMEFSVPSGPSIDVFGTALWDIQAASQG